MGRIRVYEGKSVGAPFLHVRIHPDVLTWIRTEKGLGWARALLEAAYADATGREVPFPNRTRRQRSERPQKHTEGEA